jgi:seryl-tRNA synthetase
MEPISWSLLTKAISFYENHDFSYIEVPWIVSSEATQVTFPKGAGIFSGLAGDLVGSGEQAFIQLTLDGQLPPGKYCTLTPCFRDEQVIDRLHRQYFAKVELIDLTPSQDAQRMIDLVQKFARTHASWLFGLSIEQQTTTEYDLITGDRIEIGSYGSRTYKGLSWTYGTGCAEPRWTQCKTRQ